MPAADLAPFADHTEMDWALSGGQDGSRSVELYAIDAAGNVARAKASVLLDTSPPSVVVRMAGGATYTRSTAVATTVTGTDATSGVHQMRRSGSPDLSGVPWGPFEGAFEWTVTAPDGEKHLYVELSDRAGLTALVDATIIVAAIRNRAMLVTHDESMRDVAERLGVRVSWLPLTEREGTPVS